MDELKYVRQIQNIVLLGRLGSCTVSPPSECSYIYKHTWELSRRCFTTQVFCLVLFFSSAHAESPLKWKFLFSRWIQRTQFFLFLRIQFISAKIIADRLVFQHVDELGICFLTCNVPNYGVMKGNPFARGADCRAAAECLSDRRAIHAVRIICWKFNMHISLKMPMFWYHLKFVEGFNEVLARRKGS